MSTHAELRRTHVSPGLAAILGFLLLAANFIVDVSTDRPVAPTVHHSAQTIGQIG